MNWRVEEFAGHVKVGRDRRGLTQAQLGKMVGMSYGAISRMERGRLKDPPPRELVIRLENALGIDDGRLCILAGCLPERFEVSEDTTTGMPIIHGMTAA